MSHMQNRFQILFKDKFNVLEEVINILFYIAEADGRVSNSELKMIEHIAHIFGLNHSQFESIRESRKSSDKNESFPCFGELSRGWI